MHRPLDNWQPRRPAGEFGARRKFDVHTGIDLYCEQGDKVYAIEDGTVVSIETFTGPDAGTPWWNHTQAVLVEGNSGVIGYGEISTDLVVGDQVTEGTVIGQVETVLKRDKGLPMSMLHLELYEPGTKTFVFWYLDQPKPANLLDPNPLLNQ